ncbi:MAG: tol-pal system-associated acyl-CoA thioesterase [Gammaproteobacteria bacterium]|jgi:acyl-CoA thioester hydrolase
MDTELDIPEFNWQVRVYYEDTDAAGVVYHTNYLKYMERARTEWLRVAGYSQLTLAKDVQVVFVVANINVDFISPAKFDELLNVHSTIVTTSGSRLDFRQTITNQDKQMKCRGDIKIVCIDPGSFKPKRIPDDIKAKLCYDY